jgi:hypothetical protein
MNRRMAGCFLYKDESTSVVAVVYISAFEPLEGVVCVRQKPWRNTET